MNEKALQQLIVPRQIAFGHLLTDQDLKITKSE